MKLDRQIYPAKAKAIKQADEEGRLPEKVSV